MKIREDNGSAKGLAYNNACEDARLHNKESDMAYIFERFVFHRYGSEMCQQCTLEEVEEVLKNKEFIKAVKNIVDIVEELK